MLEHNLFDEAARVLAMPIPRRKALTYVAAGFAGALLPFLWPKRATATDYDFPCSNECSDAPCRSRFGYKSVDDLCTTASGQAGHCAKLGMCRGNGYVTCNCVPGPAPDAPSISSIPDVAITREASLAAGNCEEGTDWVASWFPGRHSVSAREAAAAAIARGKPRLARYIVRTAHVVQRGAQV
jgi:hypothetical protein